MRKVLGVLLATFALAAQGRAQIHESKEWIVGASQHSIVSFLDEHGYISGKSLPTDTIALVIDAAGSFSTITALEPPNANARDLATLLSSGLTTPALIEYSQEDDYAAAQISRNSARIFQNESAQTLDLEALRRPFLEKGFKVIVALRTMNHCQVNPPSLRLTGQTRKGRYYVFIGLDSIPVITVKSVLQPLGLIVIFLVFVAPPLLVGLGIVSAAQAAKDTRIAKQIRLDRYKKTATLAIYPPIVIGTMFSMWAIFSHQMLPLCDLWFGERTSIPLTIFGMLPVLLVLPFALAASKTEMRLRSMKDVDSADFIPPKKEPLTKRRNVQIALQVVLSLLGLAIYVYCNSLPRKEYGEWPRFVAMLGFAAGMFGRHAVNLLFKLRPGHESDASASKIQRDIEDETDFVRLTKRAIELADLKKVNLVNVVISNPGDAKENLAPTFLEGTLRIPRRAIKELGEQELDFALAYTLDSVLRQIAWILVPCFGFVPLMMFTMQRIKPIQLGMVLPMVIFFPIMLSLMPVLHGRAAANGVKRALAVSPDPAAAESYFSKLRAELEPKARTSWRFTDPWKAYLKTYG